MKSKAAQRRQNRNRPRLFVICNATQAAEARPPPQSPPLHTAG